MNSSNHDYVLVIHSLEMTNGLRDAAERLGYKVNPNTGIVEDDHIMEISTGFNGVANGLNIHSEMPDVLKEIKRRHKSGDRMLGVIGCPILTADVKSALEQEGIEFPEKNLHIIRQVSEEEYKNFESNHPGITDIMNNAKSVSRDCTMTVSQKSDLLVKLLCPQPSADKVETPAETLQDFTLGKSEGRQHKEII